jgi:hypothetical protein
MTTQLFVQRPGPLYVGRQKRGAILDEPIANVLKKLKAALKNKGSWPFS